MILSWFYWNASHGPFYESTIGNHSDNTIENYWRMSYSSVSSEIPFATSSNYISSHEINA